MKIHKQQFSYQKNDKKRINNRQIKFWHKEECIMIEESVIKIVDDIMGSGKSTWAINHIKRKQILILLIQKNGEVSGRISDG